MRRLAEAILFQLWFIAPDPSFSEFPEYDFTPVSDDVLAPRGVWYLAPIK
jgi:hypothetical protein